MTHPSAIDHAVDVLKRGGIIAYPTEGVWGLGCDPFNEAAVKKLLIVKQRSIEKGFILIASSWDQVHTLIQPIVDKYWDAIYKSSHTTWVFPASSKVPRWITGKHGTIAIRITTHPVAKLLCERCGHAIISTSANISDHPPAQNTTEIRHIFSKNVDTIIEGALGDEIYPSQLKNAITHEIYR